MIDFNLTMPYPHHTVQFKSIPEILTDERCLLCGWEGLSDGHEEYCHELYSLMSGVFSVGGRDSRMVMRNTVMESRAEIPRVT